MMLNHARTAKTMAYRSMQIIPISRIEEELDCSRTIHSTEELVAQRLTLLGVTLATAESCSGGRIASRITSLAGCSEFFLGGIVAYANSAKQDLLGVRKETLEECGAVSEATVVEMVRGAQKAFGATCAVATSGIAGPEGGTPSKPVGTIWMAAAYGEYILTYLQTGNQGRAENSNNAAVNALKLLLMAVKRETIL